VTEPAGEVQPAAGIPDTMKLNEQYQACMQQLDHARTQFNFRRDVEWKFHLGLWALLLAALAYQKDIVAPGELSNLALSILFVFSLLILVCYLLVWLVGTDIADLNDKCMMDHWRKEAERLLSVEPDLTGGITKGGPQSAPAKVEATDWRDRWQHLKRLALDPKEYVHIFYGYTTVLVYVFVVCVYFVKLWKS
jgi:hypothetical protein